MGTTCAARRIMPRMSPSLTAGKAKLLGLAAALLLSFAFWAPAFASPSATGFGDWQMVHHNWEVGYVALTRFFEWPLWNPFFCGGIPMFGNPEAQHFSPLFALGLLFGTTLGAKLFVVAHATAGVCGMYKLARERLALAPSASVVASLVFSCSGFFAWHGAGGHATFLPFYFAPWLLLWSWRVEGDLRYALWVALLLALTLYEGGTYPFPYFALLLACDALTRLGSREQALATARALVVIAPLTLLLGAVRLLPIRDALSRMPRLTSNDDSLRLSEVLLMLTARDHPWRFPPHPFVWPEYGTFIGYGALALAVLGVFVAIARRHVFVLVGLVVFFSLMLGQGGDLYPWSLLHQLPVFDSLRVPSRFAVLFSLYLALCAGLALDACLGWLRRRWPARVSVLRAVALVVPLCLAADLFVVTLRTVDRWKGPPISGAPSASGFHLVAARNFHFLYASLPARHQGIAGCYAGGMNWVVSKALWSGERPQVRVQRGRAEVTGFSRTVNTLSFAAHVREPALVIVNQNFDPDFVSNVGKVAEDRGRLALELPTGEHAVRMRYAPSTLPLGLGLSAAGLAITAALAVFFTRRHTRTQRSREAQLTSK